MFNVVEDLLKMDLLICDLSFEVDVWVLLVEEEKVSEKVNANANANARREMM